MLNRRFLTLGILAVILAIIAATSSFWAIGDLRDFSGISPRPKPAGYKTQIDSQAEVTVEVKPVQLAGGKEAIFSLTLNTHTIELNYDFTKAISLEDDRGNLYRATSWSGGKGGHHLEGEIIFPLLKAKAQKVTLKMAQIGGRERSFSWEL